MAMEPAGPAPTPAPAPACGRPEREAPAPAPLTARARWRALAARAGWATPRGGQSSAPGLARHFAQLRARGSASRVAALGGKKPRARWRLRAPAPAPAPPPGAAPEEHGEAATAAEELAPLSALELVAPLTLRAGGLLAAVAAGEDPLDRMLAAVRFLLSTLAAGTAPPCGRGRAATSYRNTVQRAGVLRRPHMPIVGEMCVAWHRLGGGEGGGPGPLAVSVAEQVSYKPRLTAACTAVPELDVVFAGVAEPRARLAGPNRLEVWLAGERRLELRGRGEAYVFGASPRFLVRNLLLGATFGEFVGEARVACAATGLEAVLEFRPTPAGAAQPAHEVAGAVFRTAGDGVRREVRRLKGSWDKAVVAWAPEAGGSGQKGGGGPAAEPAVVFDFVADMADFQAAEVEVPEDALAAQVPEWISDKPMTSQELWRAVNRHVEAGEHKQTRKSKMVLTAGQRAYAADLAASGQPHCPRFFDPPAAAAGPGACWRPRLHHVAALARAAFPETPRTWGREEQW